MMENNIDSKQKKPFIGKELKYIGLDNESNPYVISTSKGNLHEGKHNDKPEYHNRISTSKYTWYNVIPFILFEQFSKMSNIYFLIIAIMQIFKEISNANGKPITLLPLSFVILINGIKDFYEDLKRKHSDDQENNRNILIFDPKTQSFQLKQWKDVQLGNIIKVKDNEYFPADCILLQSSEKDSVCYVETKSLDGETNLKLKKSRHKFANRIACDEDVGKIKGVLQCQAPNHFIYEFNGVFSFGDNGNEGSMSIDVRKEFIKENINDDGYGMNDLEGIEEKNEGRVVIDKESFLLRGSSLKQTRYVYGFVTYVGHYTKIMMNSSKAKSKTSKVENIMNNQIWLIFIFQIGLSCLGASFSLWELTKDTAVKIPYISLDHIETYNFTYFMLRLGTWIVLLNNLVPISLLLTMEMVKYIQGIFIEWDCELYDKSLRSPVIVQTSTLNEELGQVKYVFSDKTGTLTKNHMQFKKMAIGNYAYGDNDFISNQSMSDSYGNITNVCFNDHEFNSQLNNKQHENYENIDLYMKCLALCHNVIISQNTEDSQIKYQSSSPDEISMVNCARYFNYLFYERDLYDNITLLQKSDDNESIKVQYKLLALFDYSPERKRMSVLVQEDFTQRIYLFIKGADSVIFPLITLNRSLVPIMKEHTDNYGRIGLRTLVSAYKEISPLEMETINHRLYEANTNTLNKQFMLDRLAEEIETNLYLLGISGIEDQIQDKVAESIESFIEAGIKIWILTGDKKETDKSIAMSTKLIDPSFTMFEIPEETPLIEIKDKLLTMINEYNHIIKSSVTHSDKFAFVITSDILSFIINDVQLKYVFYSLACKCNSVICCRVTPKQKAQMVTLMKKHEPKSTILSIGDGANDVSMINEAHVGVGILGLEGRQAARASDYAIGQFHYLKRLLFTHGRECYRKNAYIVCYNFYKNYLFVIPQFILGFDSLFSGQTIYDPLIYQMYNIIYAQFPIIWYGIYDKEISSKNLMATPRYYTQGIKGNLFGFGRFWGFVFLGIIDAIILYIFCFKFITTSHDSLGNMIDLTLSGSITYAVVILIVNIQVIFESNNHTTTSLFLIIISIALYFASVFIMSYFPSSYIIGNMHHMLPNGNFYIRIIITISACLVIEQGLYKLSKYCKRSTGMNKIVAQEIKLSYKEKHGSNEELYPVELSNHQIHTEVTGINHDSSLN